MRCDTPIWVEPADEPIQVPCGKCLTCLSNKRKDWSIRIMNEHRHSMGSMFVTLTYNDRYIPDDAQLRKEDLQKYFKRLRKQLGQRIRYYAVGEYGTKRARPHYHILLFNVSTQDETKIRNAWSLEGDPLGIVHIGAVNSASIVYCLKYVVQPEQKKHKVRPFALMSRSYGIGGMYLTDAVCDWHRTTEANYMRVDGKYARLPRFYKEKIWYRKEDRDRINQKSLQQAEITQKLDELRMLDAGYSYADMKEMRRAFYERMKIKVAYTEKL